MMARSIDSVSCPRCGAPLRLFNDTSISWREEKREFEVVMKGICPPCGFNDDIAIKSLPLDIAQSSSCSCGGSLFLAEHSLTLSQGDVEFRGIYKCSSCSRQQKSLISRIGRALSMAWEETTSLEVGLKGIKFGKKGAPDKTP